jgi:5,10-methylene-tetrahydrofolate dehydrogenase/methenyl tetrahydrofolate cyclohydrolase
MPSLSGMDMNCGAHFQIWYHHRQWKLRTKNIATTTLFETHQKKKKFHKGTMSAGEVDTKVINGFNIAKELRQNLKGRIEGLTVTPGLAVVLVGDRKDSETYVNMKKKACAEVGIKSFDYNYPGDVDQKTLETLIDDLNANSEVHGILVQLPLPKHIDSQAVLARIDPLKDVDGLHAVNIGKLALGSGGANALEACTPKGVIYLIKSTGTTIAGKKAVVIGRSNIVGKPVALMLMRENATVTVCHSATPIDVLEETVRNSDIVVAACGRPEMIKGNWIKDGAVVIDVGTNPVEDKSKAKGFKLVGDVEFSVAKEHAAFITPVPKGVGPMTIAMLLENTYTSAVQWSSPSRGEDAEA